VVGVARKFSAGQRTNASDLELPILSMASVALAGIVASLGYVVGSAILSPDLWIEPLGALVKTGPAIVLMLVALLTLDNR
jgi:hypothetical protein